MKLKALTLLIFISFVHCRGQKSLSGKYVCVNKQCVSYFDFLPEMKVKYRDAHETHTLYIFKYKVENGKLHLSNEYGNFTLRLVDDETIEVEKRKYFFRYKLIYKKIE